MNAEIETLYPAIGRAIIGVVGSAGGKILMYAEVEDGVVSTQVFSPERGKIVYRFGGGELDDLVYDLWTKWTEVPGNQEWRAMVYLINENRKFSIDLIYPDKFNDKADVVARRTAAAQSALGALPIDYSQAQASR